MAGIDINELGRLKAAVQDIDALSQEGFGEIEALADLALRAMESKALCGCPEPIAHALEMIRGRAQAYEDHVNSRAESVGCNFKDESARRRAQIRAECASH